MDRDELVGDMMAECVADGQSARRVPSDAEAGLVRRDLRAAARARQLRIRTARLADTVVVVRTDAEVWTQDAATMRAKLTPPA